MLQRTGKRNGITGLKTRVKKIRKQQKNYFYLKQDFRKRHNWRKYSELELTHTHILTQGLAVTGPEDVKNTEMCEIELMRPSGTKR